jgi:hypothetical protein
MRMTIHRPNFSQSNNHEPGPRGNAAYDKTPGGALMLSYPKDDEFTRQLREVVPHGFLGWQRNPYCWIIDADYADEVLDLAHRYWDDVDWGI